MGNRNPLVRICSPPVGRSAAHVDCLQQKPLLGRLVVRRSVRCDEAKGLLRTR